MLKGKTALITGSTSGIGLGIARALAKEGVNVILNGLGDEGQINEIGELIKAEFGVKVGYSPANMLRPNEIRAMCEEVISNFGSIDILVNNAGIQHVSAIDEFPEEEWDKIIDINLNSAFHTIKASLPSMKTKGWGRIINIASAHGLVASPYKSAYVAAKHGLIGMTKSVALEVAEKNITVNAICPGYVLTPLVEGQIEGQAKAHNLPVDEVIEKVILAPQPTKKFVQIDEVAKLAVFLCQGSAQGITGASLSMDGGWTAR